MSRHSTFSLPLHHIFNIVFAIIFLGNSLNVRESLRKFSKRDFLFVRSVHPIYKVPRLIMFSNQFAQFPDGFNNDYPFLRKFAKEGESK